MSYDDIYPDLIGSDNGLLREAITCANVHLLPIGFCGIS